MKKREQKSLQCEIYEQMASMKCAHVRKKCGIISFCNETYEALAVFHEDSLIELSIEDKRQAELLSTFILKPLTLKLPETTWKRFLIF